MAVLRRTRWHSPGIRLLTVAAVRGGTGAQDELPYNPYYEYYGPDYKLQIATTNMENKNSRARLEALQVRTNVTNCGTAGPRCLTDYLACAWCPPGRVV